MAVEDTSARQTYALRLIQLYLECIDFSQEAQKYFFRNELDNEIVLEYVSRLLRLWKEFVPKVKDRAELKDLKDEFMKFEKYSLDPDTLLVDTSQIRRLEATLTDTFDKLGLTKLENIK
jgi:hypothetical protein